MGANDDIVFGNTVHKSQRSNITVMYDRRTDTDVIQGDWDEVLAMASETFVGNPMGKSEKACVQMSITKEDGYSATMSRTFTTYFNKSLWSVSFNCIGKPIMSLIFPNESSENNIKSVLESRVKKIKAWQTLEGMEIYRGDYIGFKYPKYSVLGGIPKILPLEGKDGKDKNSLELAQKMMRGISSYDRYYPIISCNTTRYTPFKFGNASSGDCVGFVGKASDSGSYKNADERSKRIVDFIEGMFPQGYGEDHWVKTGDSISYNSDGSFTRNEQWSGFDSVDTDLYKKN